jgi:gamma-glutamylcyclotransferase (GGCT)/AIG2-like uncharacterized protein YtfP
MNGTGLYLFVYGTLRKGFQNPVFKYLSDHFTYEADGKVKGRLYDLGEYPAAIPDGEDVYVKGELYKAKSADEFNWAISQLDDYEGVNPGEGEQQLYERAATTVFAGDKQYTAWIYWYKGDVHGKPFVESGDVMEYFKMKNK